MLLVKLLCKVKENPEQYKGTNWKVTGGSSLYFNNFNGLQKTSKFTFDNTGCLRDGNDYLMMYDDTLVEQVFEWRKVDFMVAIHALNNHKTIKSIFSISDNGKETIYVD